MTRQNGGRGMNLEGPFMHFLETFFHIWILNLLTLLLCIPVITAGAAFTAMHHQLYLISRKEDGYVIRGFFKDFKSNFKLATLCWLPMLAVGSVLGIDLYLFTMDSSFSAWYKCGVVGLTVVYLFVFVYLWPILARYDTTFKQAFKNALFMSVYGFVKTIPMVVLTIAPWVLLVFIKNLLPVVLLFGLSVPAFINIFLYRKTFEAFEKNQTESKQKNESQSAEADEIIGGEKEE